MRKKNTPTASAIVIDNMIEWNQTQFQIYKLIDGCSRQFPDGFVIILQDKQSYRKDNPGGEDDE